MNIAMIGQIARMTPIALALSACAPEFVDDVPPVASAEPGASSARAFDLEQGSIIPTTPKPSEVVDPPPVPNPGADLAPTVPAPVTPAPTRVPPRPPIWQSPPPNYGATRPGAVPRGLPSGPPATWRY